MTENQKNQIYSDEFLENICKRIGFENESDKEKFIKRVLYSADRYIELIRMNSDRLQPNKQHKALDAYSEILKQAQEKFREIQKDAAASGKLNKATRAKFSQTTEAAMREMFFPYVDEKGMAISIFEDFLGLLSEAAFEAKNQDVGNDKADLSGKTLTEFVIAIGKSWPKESSVSFALGKYDSGARIYTSPSLTILHTLILPIAPTTDEKNVETIMRKIKHEELLNQPLASYFLA